MTDDALHRRLLSLLKKTASAATLKPPAWWVGDVAGERRVLDDWTAGRVFWRAAHKDAESGIKALEAADRDMAEMLAWSATDHYVAALEARVRPSDVKILTRSAQPRGRRKKN